MKTYTFLYEKIYARKNLIEALKKARKGKAKKEYVQKFEERVGDNIKKLQSELQDNTYQPRPLVQFTVRDPKTRRISKSDFRDRIVHHALVNVLEPIFEKRFIHDCVANRKGKGTLFALQRFIRFLHKVSRNGKETGWYAGQVKGYCFKADIRHYFNEVNHMTLLAIIRKKVADERVIALITKILNNQKSSVGGGRTPSVR